MRVGIIGAGHIGGNLAHFLAGAGHNVVVTFAREPGALERLAAQIGPRTRWPGKPPRRWRTATWSCSRSRGP